MADATALTRVSQLLDQLLGAQQAQSMLDRLLQSDEPISTIIRDVLACPTLERRYKEARTLDIKADSRKEVRVR